MKGSTMSEGRLPGYHVFGNVFFCRRMNALHVCDDTCCYLSTPSGGWCCPVSGRRRMEEDVTMTAEVEVTGGKRSRGGEERKTIASGNQNVCHAGGMEKRMRT